MSALLLRPRTAVFFLAPLLAMAAGLGCATSRAVVEESPHGTAFRVMSWNVNYGLAPDAEAIDLIQRADVDVILLQETNARWAKGLKRHLRKEFKYQRHHDDSAAGGLSVLSRFPILEDDLIPNTSSWFPAQRTVIQTPAGPVQTLNVHLRPPFDDDGSVITGYFNTKSIRGDEIAEFLASLDPALPAIVAGDFNEADGHAVRALDDDGFESALFAFAPEEKTWHWPVPLLGEITGTLDHVFVDARLQTIDAWVLHEGQSDHYPVVAWIQPPTRRAAAAAPVERSSIGDVTSGYRMRPGSR